MFWRRSRAVERRWGDFGGGMWEFMPDDCPVGTRKVEVELRLCVQLELSTVVGKSPLRWIFTLGVTNQGAIPPIDTCKIDPGC